MKKKEEMKKEKGEDSNVGEITVIEVSKKCNLHIQIFDDYSMVFR